MGYQEAQKEPPSRHEIMLEHRGPRTPRRSESLVRSLDQGCPTLPIHPVRLLFWPCLMLDLLCRVWVWSGPLCSALAIADILV